MSRTGKIARLPRKIREQLNHRLQDGEGGLELVSWLNGLPEVKEVLAERFGARPINEVNLTEWRQGGFVDWERHEEALALVGNVAERSRDLEAEAEGEAIADRLAALLATELALYAETVLRETGDPKERWERLRGMLQELAKLRREDHRAARVAIERERWEAELDRRQEEEMEKERKAAKAKMLSPLFAAAEANELAKVLGGGEEAREVAAQMVELQHDLPPGTLGKPGGAPGKGGKKTGAAPKAKARRTRKKRPATAAPGMEGEGPGPDAAAAAAEQPEPPGES